MRRYVQSLYLGQPWPVHKEDCVCARGKVGQRGGGHWGSLTGLRGADHPGPQLLLQQRLQRACVKVACPRQSAGAC